MRTTGLAKLVPRRLVGVLKGRLEVVGIRGVWGFATGDLHALLCWDPCLHYPKKQLKLDAPDSNGLG